MKKNIENLQSAVYIRVSTDMQTEYSPDSQLKLIKEYAKNNNIEILEEHIYQDKGISGRHAEKRDEFNKMISIAKKKPKPFDCILIYDFSRFARNREDSIIYKNMLRKKLGIDVISITQPLSNDKNAVILEAMFEAMDEYYSLNLSDNVKRGKLEKASRGEFQGQAPYGYKYSKDLKKLVIDENKAKIIQNIFNDFINGTSVVDIARKLNTLNVPTTKNKKWEVIYITSILNNPVYIGKIRYTEGGTKRNYHNPNSLIVDGNHEPIINLDTWNLVQEKNKLNCEIYSHKERQKAKHSHWLSGIVKCSNCNHSLVKNATGFRCNGYVKGQCSTSSYIPVSKLENLIIEQLKTVPNEKLDINIVKKENNSNNEIDLLNIELKKLQEKEERVKTAYENAIYSLEDFKERYSNIKKDIEKINKDIKELSNKQNSQKEEELIYQKCEEAYKILIDETTPLDTKFITIHQLIDKIIYNKSEQQLTVFYK